MRTRADNRVEAQRRLARILEIISELGPNANGGEFLRELKALRNELTEQESLAAYSRWLLQNAEEVLTGSGEPPHQEPSTTK